LLFERGNWGVSVKPWYIVNDSDDNPDIEDFMGYGELRAAWAPTGNRHVVTLMLRNQLESGFDRGAAELSWSFPFFDYPWVKGYLQYFHGYGESLIDYDRRVNRIGIGVAFSDWLD
jgi:Outer membrane phospholipase A